MAENSKITGSRILVTGGAGFIGSFVIELLLPHNPKKVIIIDNFIRGTEANMQNFANHPAIELHKGDIRDLDLLESCIAQSDYVFHMAALRINACYADPEQGFEVMCTSTFRVAQLCVKHKIKKVIYSSSASVYGLAQNFPTPESDNPYDNQTFYGGAKLWGEQLFRSFKFMYDLDYVGLRYFNVYGPRMDTDGKYTEVLIKWLDCIRDNTQPRIFGDGKDTMDFVHVRDVAASNVAALLSDATDTVFNVGAQTETSLAQLLDALLEVNDSQLEPTYVEVKKENPVSRRLADISLAKNLLNFSPNITLHEGLKELSTWYFDKQEKS